VSSLIDDVKRIEQTSKSALRVDYNHKSELSLP